MLIDTKDLAAMFKSKAETLRKGAENLGYSDKTKAIKDAEMFEAIALDLAKMEEKDFKK